MQFVLRRAANPCHILEYLICGHVSVERVHLRAIAEQRFVQCRLVVATHAIDEDVALRDGRVVREHFECGRFAGTVDAQQTETFAFLHHEIDALHRTHVVERFMQIRHDDCVLVQFSIAHQCLRQILLHLDFGIVRAAIQLNAVRVTRFLLRRSCTLKCEKTSNFFAPINALANEYQVELYERNR